MFLKGGDEVFINGTTPYSYVFKPPKRNLDQAAGRGAAQPAKAAQMPSGELAELEGLQLEESKKDLPATSAMMSQAPDHSRPYPAGSDLIPA